MVHPLTRYYDVQRDEDGSPYLEVYVTGVPLQRLPLLNKGTAFTLEERRLLELDGLLPPHVATLEEQKERIYRQWRLEQTPLEKHIMLRNLQDRNEVLFYAVLADHLEEMLPIIYTPTVGEAVRNFSMIYQLARGLAISGDRPDHASRAVANLPLNDVRLVVATDSSAILGIGDQGFGGMGIAIGKLSIYTVGGGIGPDKVLPVELDVGTNREDLLNDPLYLGIRQKRMTGAAYYAVMDAFVEAISKRYPGVVIQWEDFSKEEAWDVLERYRDRVPSFNDDIQGTGAVALAGVLAACRMNGESIRDHRFVISGAGAGGLGVAWALREGLKAAGATEDEALRQVLVLDSRGLLVEGRVLDASKESFAQPEDAIEGWEFSGDHPGLVDTIHGAKATVLIGLSGQGGQFSEPIVKAVAANTERPLIFPMSNPTSHAEAVPEDVIRWTDGRAIVATGSPFSDVEYEGVTHQIGQGNNAFIFPGLGFGSVLAKVTKVTDGMVLAAANALAAEANVDTGRIYPEIPELGEISAKVAAAVITQACADGVARDERVQGLEPAALEAYVRERSWEPVYLPFRRASGV